MAVVRHRTLGLRITRSKTGEAGRIRLCLFVILAMVFALPGQKNSLYLGDSSDMNHTPDQIRQPIHVLDEWAAHTTGISAFIRSD